MGKIEWQWDIESVIIYFPPPAPLPSKKNYNILSFTFQSLWRPLIGSYRNSSDKNIGIYVLYFPWFKSRNLNVWTSHSLRPLESASVNLPIIHLLFSIYYVCYRASVKYIKFPDTYLYGNETLISLPTFRAML